MAFINKVIFKFDTYSNYRCRRMQLFKNNIKSLFCHSDRRGITLSIHNIRFLVPRNDKITTY